MNNDSSDVVFWGDFICDNCNGHVSFRWRKRTMALHCPHCRRQYSREEIIRLAENYNPERSTVSDAEIRRIVEEKLGEEQPVFFGASLTDGSPPTPPKPERSFWHPLEFGKNLLVGAVVLIGGQILWELKQSIFGDDWDG